MGVHHNGTYLSILQANNPYLENYDPSERTSYIGYFDFNALYSYIMTKKLPISDYEWVDEADFELDETDGTVFIEGEAIQNLEGGETGMYVPTR